VIFGQYLTLSCKWYKIEPLLLWNANRNPYPSFWIVPFSVTFNDPNFKITPLFDVEYFRNGTSYTHGYNQILIRTYTRPTLGCHFEWPWMTLSDLVKYSAILCTTESLCDNWASCIMWTQQSLSTKFGLSDRSEISWDQHSDWSLSPKLFGTFCVHEIG